MELNYNNNNGSANMTFGGSLKAALGQRFCNVVVWIAELESCVCEKVGNLLNLI